MCVMSSDTAFISVHPQLSVIIESVSYTQAAYSCIPEKQNSRHTVVRMSPLLSQIGEMCVMSSYGYASEKIT